MSTTWLDALLKPKSHLQNKSQVRRGCMHAYIHTMSYIHTYMQLRHKDGERCVTCLIFIHSHFKLLLPFALLFPLAETLMRLLSMRLAV